MNVFWWQAEECLVNTTVDTIYVRVVPLGVTIGRREALRHMELVEGNLDRDPISFFVEQGAMAQALLDKWEQPQPMDSPITPDDIKRMKGVLAFQQACLLLFLPQ